MLLEEGLRYWFHLNWISINLTYREGREIPNVRKTKQIVSLVTVRISGNYVLKNSLWYRIYSPKMATIIFITIIITAGAKYKLECNSCLQILTKYMKPS